MKEVRVSVETGPDRVNTARRAGDYLASTTETSTQSPPFSPLRLDFRQVVPLGVIAAVR
jgi:hypothetical protein